MKPFTVEQARLFAQALTDAADQAEAEGREHLYEGDLVVFAKLDDDARATLQAAIDKAA